MQFGSTGSRYFPDIVETIFLNMFHGGKLKAMPPKLRSDDKRNVVIRPLAFYREKNLIEFAEAEVSSSNISTDTLNGIDKSMIIDVTHISNLYSYFNL